MQNQNRQHDLELLVLKVNNCGDVFPPLEKQIPLRQQVAPPDQRRQQVAPPNLRTQLVALLTELSPPQHQPAYHKAWTLALKLEPAMNLAGQRSTWGMRCDSCTALTRKSYDVNFGDFTCASGTLLQPGFASC